MENIPTFGILLNIDIFLIIMIRILGFFTLLPIISTSNVPNLMKIMLSFSMAYIVFASGIVSDIDYQNSILGFLMVVTKEFFVGFIMAFVVFLVFSIIYFVGQLIDYQIGFSMANIFDPVTSMQVPIIGNILYFAMGVLFIQSGGLNVLVSSLFYSYKVLPVGDANIVQNQPLIAYLLGMLTEFFVFGMKFALPIVGTMLSIDIALGLLVKAVPQMNIFVVGMPIKIFLGLILMFILTPTFVEYFNEIYNMVMIALFNAIGGMTDDI